jgi:hypothetical protein
LADNFAAKGARAGAAAAGTDDEQSDGTNTSRVRNATDYHGAAAVASF